MTRGMLEPLKILSEDETSEQIGAPPRTLQRWRANGDGPPYVRLGPRRIGYRAEDVATWLESRTYKHRAHELNRRGAKGEE